MGLKMILGEKMGECRAENSLLPTSEGDRSRRAGKEDGGGIWIESDIKEPWETRFWKEGLFLMCFYILNLFPGICHPARCSIGGLSWHLLIPNK